MLYSGIDLHKDNCVISTVNQKGEMIKQSKLPNHNISIIHYFSGMGKPHKAVVESTANWYWLSDLLKENGIEILLAHAKYLKAISYAKVKTDKVDSQTLADLLRMNMIPEAHQISREKRTLRDLMRARLRLVTKRTSCFNSIHRLLGKYNIAVPADRNLHDLSTLDLLINLALDQDALFQLELLKDQVRLLHKQINQLEKSLHPRLIPNEDIQRLLWIPGIGKVLAFSIYLEVDGIDRFADVNKFYSYCRLVPGADNSNRKQRHKSANKDGNRYLKIAFMEAGIKARQYYKEIRQYYQSKACKKHKNIARNLVSLELARITYYVLKNKTGFNNRFKGRILSKQKITQWPRLASPGA
jgi:transposase